jgi:hypothetical protein
MNLISQKFLEKIKMKAKNALVMTGDFMHINEQTVAKCNPPKKRITLNEVKFFNDEFCEYECKMVVSNCGSSKTARKYMVDNNINYVHFTKDGKFIPVDVKNKSCIYIKEENKYKPIIF